MAKHTTDDTGTLQIIGWNGLGAGLVRIALDSKLTSKVESSGKVLDS